MAKRPAKWVADKIEAGRQYVNRMPCPRCGSDVLRGPDTERAPTLTATVNPDPVDVHAAAIAYARGRHSYALITTPAGARLEHRTWDYRPAKYPIVLDHRCEQICQ